MILKPFLIILKIRGLIQKNIRILDMFFLFDGKFNFDESRAELISKTKLEQYVFLSNNGCESFNHLKNSFIAITNKANITRFEINIKKIFVR